MSEEKAKHLEKQLIGQERENSLKDKNLEEMTQSRDKAISQCETLKQEVKNSKNKTQQKVGDWVGVPLLCGNFLCMCVGKTVSRVNEKFSEARTSSIPGTNPVF